MKSIRLQVLALAVAGVLAVPAMGQYRVGDDGRALDANNRVGSGGRNEGRPNYDAVTGNQIVTGNVTGGRHFRGNINYSDPTAFRGRTAGINSDRFIRESAGTAEARARGFTLSQPRPFYGESQTVNPPAGFVQRRWTGNYVPAPNLGDDLRLDQPVDSPLLDVPTSTETLLPGPLDATNQQTLLAASPLYGVRPLRLGEQSDRQFVENFTSLRQADAFNRTRLTDEEIQRMRGEFGADQQQETGTDPAQRQAGEGDQQQPLQPGGTGTVNPAMTPAGTPADPAANAGPIQPRALNGDLSTGQGIRNRLLVPPEQQSRMYAELNSRLERQRQIRGDVVNDVVAQNELMQQLRWQQQQQDAQASAQPPARGGQPGDGTQQQPQPRSGADAVKVPDFRQMNQQDLDKAAQGEQGTDDATAGADDPAGRATTPDQARIPKPEPLKVRSLAQGVTGKGLADLLTAAEEQMRQGKYTAALDKYDAAEQVAPNNPLVKLGRANAELGASYYARAEADLREAFLKDPALLMGQYDLREFLGQERLQFLVKDLKEIANTEKSEARPVFLLAYIAYNTGNELQAAGYLELAEKRAGAGDPLFPLLREHWSLPEAPAAKDEATK